MNAEREEYEQNIARVRQLSSDEDAIQQHLDDSVGGLRHDAPRISGHAEATTAAAIGYLSNQAPVPPPNLSPMQAKAWQPSDAQVRQYNQLYRTVDMPLSILSDASQGTLTRQQVDAINAVYPTLMGEIRQRIVKRIEENPDISASSRRMASLILGLDLDGQFSPATFNSAQQMYQQQMPPPAQQQMPVYRAKGLGASGRSGAETEAWRAAQRGVGSWNKQGGR